MARLSAPRLPLVGLAACLRAGGMTWEQAATALFISPATLRSYASRGAPLAMVTALTLLLDLPGHSPRSLFVRPTEGLKMRVYREPHGTHLHKPALRGAAEQHHSPGSRSASSVAGGDTPPVPFQGNDWDQLALPLWEA